MNTKYTGTPVNMMSAPYPTLRNMQVKQSFLFKLRITLPVSTGEAIQGTTVMKIVAMM